MRTSTKEGLGGILSFFIFSLVISIILTFIIGITEISSLITDKSIETSSKIWLLPLDFLLFSGYIGFGIYSLIALAKRKPNAVALVKMTLIIYFVSNVMNILFALVSGEPLTDNSSFFYNDQLVIRSFIYSIVWFLYFTFSKRVKNTFPKHERRIYNVDRILFISIIAIPLLFYFFAFLSLPSKNIAEFEESLPLTYNNLQIGLNNIHTEFSNYDLEFSVTRLMNLANTPDSVFTSMDKRIGMIKEEINFVDEEINNYTLKKNKISSDKISDEGKIMDEEVEQFIEEYRDHKPQIDSCITNMSSYRQFILLIQESEKVTEQWGDVEDIMYKYVEAGEYTRAAESVKKLKEIVIDIQENLQKREDLGIQMSSENVLNSYTKYKEAYNIYYEYLLMDEDNPMLAQTYEEFLKTEAEAMDLLDDNRSITEIVNEIDSWYQKSIGICFPFFEEYDIE